MKKILLLFSAVGMLSLTGCNNDDYDEDTISEVFETQAIDFTSAGNYEALIPLNPSLPAADMLLVYRLVQEEDADRDVWELIPTTKYNVSGVEGAEIDYGFNFTQVDLLLYMGSNDNLESFPEYTQDQIFRVVIIPGYASNFRTSANSMDQFKDYNAVIKKYGINDSKIKKISVK